MINLKELLKGKDFSSLSKEHQDNLMILLERINKVRIAWAKPMLVTSGYRSIEDHLRIYNQMGIPANKVPMQSRHLSGAAVDISDPKGELFTWVQNNIKLMEDIGLWMEEKDAQKRVHFQIFPPKSGKRFFKP